MLATATISKFFIAALFVTNLQGVPPKGWVQMLSNSFDTRAQCMEYLWENEYMIYRSLYKTFKTTIKGIEKFGCFLEEDVIRMNKDLGHDTDEYKDIDMLVYNNSVSNYAT